MEQIETNEAKKTEIMSVVSQALTSIYTGMFYIDLLEDKYSIVNCPDSITFMLNGISSAQQAINTAIQQTVAQEEILDILTFVNLRTLPDRMAAETCLNVDYRGSFSGWVRGSFIQSERDNEGKLIKVLYTYQVIDDEKRKELEGFQQLKDNYARTKKDDEEEKNSLKNDNKELEDKNVLLTNENAELQRARDAVYSPLNSGSYLCTYAEDGETLLSIKFSDALRKLYGYANEEDAPDTWDMWLKGAHPDDRKYVADCYQEALRDRTGSTNYDVTYRAIKKDGTIHWYRAVGHTIRREDGSAEFCYGYIMDIDEQKKASDMLERALEEAKIANAAKTSFLARISHDIRTPMNGIIGLIDINDKHADDIEFTSKNRKKAKVAANHLLSLINDVLQLSKLEDASIELAEIPFNMLSLLDDIFTITEMRAKENGILIRRNDADSIQKYPYLYGSPLHIRQIYINLLGNSIKYNKKNGRIFCDLSAEQTDPEHILFKMVIEDTGIGMSQEFQKRLFDPFAREHEEITGKYEGTGLGLAIVKQLIDKMDGTIQVESKVDEGSRFIVKLPFRIASEDEVKRTEEPEDVGNIQGKSILLVEDNELNMDISETILTDAGANVTKAVNGKLAVETFQTSESGTFDMILMDVMMPVMNGYEATRYIRSLDRTDAKEIPIIALTANAFAEDVEKAKKAGMNDHLAKPLDIQRMLTLLAKYVKS